MSTSRFSLSLAIPTVWLLFRLVMPAQGKYNDYDLNKPSAFRDYLQVMIWDGEILDALWGLRGRLMFSTGSCFSGGFVDDLTKPDHAAVVTANNWHGFSHAQTIPIPYPEMAPSARRGEGVAIGRP